jgi:pimeloyl-ACP methyl ester carboxylesterase
MASRSNGVRRKNKAVPLPIWQELLVAVEVVCLKVSPVYWGFGIPPGDGSAVVVVPGFMGTDLYLSEFRAWLGRIGYKPYHSKIGLNAECPNLLIRQHLERTVESACRTTRKRVHIIGHSLGGLMARAIASQMPDQVASVITMGSPFRGISAHSSILHMADLVRDQILQRHGEDVLPNCYTSRCTCDFLESIAGTIPRSVRQSAIYTKSDGIVDWRVCRTGRPSMDFEVSATHLGLAFNPIVYDVVARRLAAAQDDRVVPAPARAPATASIVQIASCRPARPAALPGRTRRSAAR